ncbi:Sec-independent protein translocase TatB [Frondihabitans australicus]|uniref:Sec-independent protein translocase protein TatB n=1 Tax=Frondihabitans australicus TaxID=386892 RepID=A0A495IFU9_9MICO|nr:Sec-independent protein translocase TatB [Frondihabitans australicus]RKR74892.1 sec-independent protein translocase protein TatB [Frondihabitans australicus]
MLQSLDKLFVIGLIAILLLGPTRLPTYAAKLAGLVRTVRGMADQARERMRDEMGDEFADMDWQKLDPRQYDPRRIIRDALLEEPTTAISTPASAASGELESGAGSVGFEPEYVPVPSRTVIPLAVGEAPPYDNEAT